MLCSTWTSCASLLSLSWVTWCSLWVRRGCCGKQWALPWAGSPLLQWRRLSPVCASTPVCGNVASGVLALRRYMDDTLLFINMLLLAPAGPKSPGWHTPTLAGLLHTLFSCYTPAGLQ